MSEPSRAFEIVRRELNRLQMQFLKLHVRALEDYERLEHLDEHSRGFEQLMAAVQRWRAALGLPQLADED